MREDASSVALAKRWLLRRAVGGRKRGEGRGKEGERGRDGMEKGGWEGEGEEKVWESGWEGKRRRKE